MMKYIDEFRDNSLARALARSIANLAEGSPEVTLMEVCGTHTVTVFKHGLKDLIPDNIILLAGPGCPVCVTPTDYIDKAIAYARLEGVTVATFGDLFRVPGSSSSLEKERAKGGDIRIVYSPLDALRFAQENGSRKVIFLGVGFETTAPLVAVSIQEARRRGISNYLVFSAHKVMPPPMEALVSDGELRIDGFLCPGHVSTIIGWGAYRFLSQQYRIPCVVAGFEPLDVLEGIGMLLRQIRHGEIRVENQYRRAVREEGNPKALALMEKVFETSDSEWRGLGIIPGSGLTIRDSYRDYDAEANIEVEVEPASSHPGCICGSVLKGVKTPFDCSLFRRVCTPENPLGACMVSSEGTCSVYYKYSDRA